MQDNQIKNLHSENEVELDEMTELKERLILEIENLSKKNRKNPDRMDFKIGFWTKDETKVMDDG
jgi:hypothetical protein